MTDFIDYILNPYILTNILWMLTLIIITKIVMKGK